jgi:hypothetical protein
MIDMGMGQKNKKRAVFFSPARANNPGQVLCLFGESPGVYQDNGIRGGDDVGIGRYYIDLPDQGIECCSRRTRDR